MTTEQLVDKIQTDVSRTFFVFGGIAGLIVGAAGSLIVQGLLS